MNEPGSQSVSQVHRQTNQTHKLPVYRVMMMLMMMNNFSFALRVYSNTNFVWERRKEFSVFVAWHCTTAEWSEEEEADSEAHAAAAASVDYSTRIMTILLYTECHAGCNCYCRCRVWRSLRKWTVNRVSSARDWKCSPNYREMQYRQVKVLSWEVRRRETPKVLFALPASYVNSQTFTFLIQIRVEKNMKVEETPETFKLRSKRWFII